ncbi:PQQ-binding-like beta-propeller repeat protein [Actinomycetospora sp. TBRC 11914]|uniref:outer membrane protein assembly factor BamB family protein n=1 Tax=Actinomycetospora sp. TBRC 11914 TaxID=2729387 RepID=UPI00145DB2B7|nr:PQQ-binding-like beta-propeller repeat protein [Actinomycetospora sp. TBRC 11914]NMO93001.1 PQQ-binding-like beta-propeller repeat protein [Actinomycetospora sp. TBRC 11914]
MTRRARWGRWTAALVPTVVGVLVLAGCSSGSSDSDAGPAAPPPQAPATVAPYPAPSVPASGAGLVLPAVAGAPAPPPTPTGGVRAGADWTTYHGDATRAGYVAAGPDPANPGLAWQTPLDGKVYGSPVVVAGEVVAATEGGSVYGLDAVTGAVRWRTHLADPLPGSALPCGNIDPIGITGSPALDPASGQVFVATTEAGVRHQLYGIDPANGGVRSKRDADVPGVDPATHLQRGALLVDAGTVYVPYGGNYGDCGQYRGSVVGLPTTGTGPAKTFVVPTSREAGIWAASGPAALPNGDVIVTTGNGEATSGTWDHSDSVLRLSSALALVDGFAPQQWAEENSADADLGSMGPVLMPGTHYVVTAGKGGNVFLVDLAGMGGVGGQKGEVDGCEAYGGGAAAPVQGGGAVAYLPCSSGLLQVRVGTDGRLVKGWQAPSQVTGSPLIVGTTVWSLQQDGALIGLDAATGTERARVSVGDSTRFATPALSGNALFLPTNHGISAVRIGG